MAATISYGPHLTPAVLNAILTKTVANCTRHELKLIQDAISRIGVSPAPGTLISAIIT